MVNIYQVSDTRWSNALTTYNAIWMDVNNGAGGAAVGASASRLLKLTNNTTEVFVVNLSGAMFTAGKAHFNGTIGTSPTCTIGEAGSGQVIVRSAGAFGFTSTTEALSAPDTILARDAANTLALRNSTNAQTFNIYNTYTDASNYEAWQLAWLTNIFTIGPISAGTGSANRNIRISAGNGTGQIAFRTGGVDAWQISSSGHFLASTDATYTIGSTAGNRPLYVVASANFYLGSGAVGQWASTGFATTRTNNARIGWSDTNATAVQDAMFTSPAVATIQHGNIDTNTTTTALTSISFASPAVVTTASAHNLSVGTPVKFTTTGSLPTGLVVGTQYYVSVVGSSTTYQVSATVGGASINTSGAGSGTHSQVVGPISQYIRMQGAITGTDLVGAPTYILGSAGTGAGAGGSIIFQVAPASGSSGTQNSYATALTIDSTKLATFGGNILMPPTNSKISFVSGSYGFEYYANDLGFLNTNGADWAIRFQTFRSPVFLSNAIVGFCSSSVTAYGNTADTAITRDSAGVLSNRNSTNAQNFRVYTTYTDTSNGAWAFINAAQTGGTEGGAANTLTFGTIGNGTGAAVLTKFKLLVDGTNRLDYNVTTANTWVSNGGFIASTFATSSGSGVYLDSNGVRAPQTGYLGISSSGAGFNAPDIVIQRVQQGVLRVSATTSGTTFCGIQFVAATYASLPTAASAGAGARFYITDGTTSTFYATVSGTGANAVCVFSDGVQYRVG